VLGQKDQTLEVVGAVDNIAPTEDIRSARFLGDRGFIVTFKKTDPLFALDLADPRNPHIKGELKIPGFSTYIHPMDKDHLLTIGFDADNQGSFAWFQGIQLQIFDITDMANPRLEHKTLIGTRGSSSEATGNHLAFNYFPAKQLLALPMVICEGIAGGPTNGHLTFNGLMVWKTSPTIGFQEIGRVSHRSPELSQNGCYNWWQSPNSLVQRSIIMDNAVYSLSPAQLKVNLLEQLSTDLRVFDLPVPITPQPFPMGG